MTSCFPEAYVLEPGRESQVSPPTPGRVFISMTSSDFPRRPKRNESCRRWTVAVSKQINLSWVNLKTTFLFLRVELREYSLFCECWGLYIKKADTQRVSIYKSKESCNSTFILPGDRRGQGYSISPPREGTMCTSGEEQGNMTVPKS